MQQEIMNFGKPFYRAIAIGEIDGADIILLIKLKYQELYKKAHYCRYLSSKNEIDSADIEDLKKMAINELRFTKPSLISFQVLNAPYEVMPATVFKVIEQTLISEPSLFLYEETIETLLSFSNLNQVDAWILENE